VVTQGDTKVESKQKGTLKLEVGDEQVLELRDVLVVPSFGHNLLSLSRLLDGNEFKILPTGMEMIPRVKEGTTYEGKPLIIPHDNNNKGMFILQARKEMSNVASTNQKVHWDVAHQSLGHVSKGHIIRLEAQ